MIVNSLFVRTLSSLVLLCAILSSDLQRHADPLMRKKKTRILMISTPFDHPHGTHMYTHEGKLLGHCLEQIPGVDVILSEGWPKDPAKLKDLSAVVFYSKSAFEIMMSDSTTKKQALELFNSKKTGLACIHMSTLTHNDSMLPLLGARWFFKQTPGGLNLDVRPTRIEKTDPHHPISRGWETFEMRDEIYIAPVLHPNAKPLVKVMAREGEEVVTWTFERDNGGRSFGTTLGHFHETFRTASFRRMLVNGILWSAGLKIPREGGPIGITDSLDVLHPNPRALAVAEAEPLDESRFEKQILVSNCNDPMQIEVRPNGDVYFIERNGNLRLYKDSTREVRTLGKVPVHLHVEVGLLGLALAPDFEQSQDLYMFFSPAGKKKSMRVSRFHLQNGTLDLSSEKLILEYAADTDNGHQGGGLYMCSNGDLLIGTGDNTNHMAELPVDQRPGKELFDAQRTAANSASMRGKVLRVHPKSDGGYSIPAGNLFPSTDSTLAEIYAMGVRNAFRLSEDPINGWVYWGDVGQNINIELGIGPNGYDEVNQARTAGNFGWPMFTGPNEAHRNWDAENKKAGQLFDVTAPKNLSRNNTGIKNLPSPQGAFIWYPSTLSEEFPMLGSGGRSVMVGPVYHWADIWATSVVRMPAQYDNSVFIYDWMRNWIKVVKLDMQGKIRDIIPFMADATWRKPIDIKFRSDHSLYVAELGDRWSDNQDSQISRIIYRRGNRAPVAELSASPSAGTHPLIVHFDAGSSFDKDKDSLLFSWTIKDDSGHMILSSEESNYRFKYSFEKPGAYLAVVTVRDENNAFAKDSMMISVGNSLPAVTIKLPEHGSFFRDADSIPFVVHVTDADEGSTTDGKIDPMTVSVSRSHSTRWVRDKKAQVEPAGLQLIRATTCFSCHQTASNSVGPSYTRIAQRYDNNNKNRDLLARKILEGGKGAWGDEVAMPPHPQHNPEQARLMVEWILSLKETPKLHIQKGVRGTLPLLGDLEEPKRRQGSVIVVEANYTDMGAHGQPSLTGSDKAVLRSMRQRAINFSRAKNAEVVEVFEGMEGRNVQFMTNGYIVFDDVNLRGITSVKIRFETLSASPVRLQLMRDHEEGQVLGSIVLPPGSGFREIVLPVKDPAGVHDLVVAVNGDVPTALLNLAVIEFQ